MFSVCAGLNLCTGLSEQGGTEGMGGGHLVLNDHRGLVSYVQVQCAQYNRTLLGTRYPELRQRCSRIDGLVNKSHQSIIKLLED